MTTAELLSHLGQLNVSLRADNGQLILNGPKGVLTPALRSELAERKAEILALLNDTAGAQRPQRLALQPGSRNGRLPLSFAQQRLWFLDQYEPDKSFYNMSYGLRLAGGLDIAALEQSLNEIVRRHEALRTIFPLIEGEPNQIIMPALNRFLAVIDLRQHAGNQREQELRRLASEEARRPFDLAQGPLFRACLVRLTEDDQVLLLTLHHIVADGWSMGVLRRELAVLYQAFSHSQVSPLPDLALQYADYAVWQREWLTGAELERQVSYWKKQLEESPGVLNLPADRPRPAVQTYHGGRLSFELSQELTQGLKALSQKEGATLFMILLAGFQVLLYRYTGQEDIVVGSPIANRNRTELEALIGFFANTLVLRGDLSGNPSFRGVLQRVRKVALEAYEHQDLPFEKLVEELKPERSLSHSPLFQVMFVLHNTPVRQRELSGLTSNQVKLDNATTKFDLTMSLSEQPDGLKGSLEYSTDLFDEATMTRLSGHFVTLLKGILAEPEQRISALPILGESEMRELLTGWNDTRREYPRDKCVHELFQEQAERTPDAVAVVFEDEQLTYRELNQRANQLARYLSRLGVGPESLVGVCAERSLEMVVGILGILKAGAAYVPQDPRFPRARLAFMWEDTQISVLLSQERLAGTLPPFAGKLVCLDRDWEEISRQSDANFASGTLAENLAYVIYTSGSTGKPKGVQIAHNSLVNALSHVREALRFTERDTLPLLANICFDISAMELFLPLVTGARLVVVSAQVAIDGERIEQALSNCGATIMHATPATWRLLLQAGWNGHDKPTSLCGGEALASELAIQLASRSSSLWNLYGPTETTIYSSAAVYRPELTGETVAIGRPIGNTQMYIVDDYLQPVPIGVPGQLYIGGTGLARGYLNRTELTAESFIPNPFSPDPGARLYRTGDVARYLPDGNIQYLGRVDHQVKLRGFRIEPGEIEAVLAEHPKVRQSVVLAREDVAGDKQLVAYAVLDHGSAADANELRTFLKSKLPEYMVPSAFVFLDSFPLTANGKLDRKALPAPTQRSPEATGGETAPRTAMEELVAKVWAEVLKLDKFGVHDNFFDLGGHSLKATQVMSRLREAVRSDLPLRVLFEGPTVAELASRIEQSVSSSAELQELARTLADLESLTDEEAERQLEKSS
jgi:amino acid adenylation domain-containing protein